jgi:hypothetical protein
LGEGAAGAETAARGAGHANHVKTPTVKAIAATRSQKSGPSFLRRRRSSVNAPPPKVGAVALGLPGRPNSEQSEED